MLFEEAIMLFFRDYTPAIALLAGLFFGDLMLLLGILAGAGKTNFFLIILFGFIGGLIHDIAFYYLANSKSAYHIKKKLKLSKKRNKIAEFIEKMGNGHYFLPVLMAKFVYGVRDAVILYVAHNNKKLKKYLLVVSGADAIWLVTITSVGWLAGRGFTSIIGLFKGFEKWLFYLLAAIVLIYLLNKFIISVILREIKRHTNRLLKNIS
jgi:membrane protein DedA with SNARE-associated domain